MKKMFSYLVACFFILQVATAQSASNALPPSFLFSDTIFSNALCHEIQFLQDRKQLLAEDRESIKDGHPLRIAIGVDVDINVSEQNAQWITLPSNRKIWQQVIKMENAEGMILLFENLFIPPNDTLFVYTANRKEVQVYTHETNPRGGVFATGSMYQNEIVFEYQPSPASVGEPQIILSNVAYLYRNRAALADDVSCYINVGCEEGDNWVLQKDGVVGLEIALLEGRRRNWYVCSGSLVNNVRQDKTPYILTANHCIEGYDEVTLSSLKFLFFKESTSADCTDETKTSTTTKSLTGCSLIADIPLKGASDGTLLKINDDIPSDWEVYYNGWDATGNAVTSGVCIHHPDGQLKKISTFTQSAISTGKVSFGSTYITAANANWEVEWAPTANGHSVTYEGSSGAPLFNQNGLIVGTMSGGNSYCIYPTDHDFFGKFSFHFDGYVDETQWFKKYLDPDDTGIKVLEGYDPHKISEENAPEAMAATNIEEQTFTANWSGVEGATAYYLDVYQKNGSEIIYADGYQSKNVGDVVTFHVSGLNSETEYFYVVRAGARIYLTQNSNEIQVSTLAGSNVKDNNAVSTTIFVREGCVVIRSKQSNVSVQIYNPMGQLLLSQPLMSDITNLPTTLFPAGLYVVKVGTTTEKIIIK